MKILSFVVNLECDSCNGTGKSSLTEEPFACTKCHGKGMIPGTTSYEQFAKLLIDLNIENKKMVLRTIKEWHVHR